MAIVRGETGAEFFARMIAENGGEAAYIRDTVIGFARSALQEKPLKGVNREILELWQKEFMQECSDSGGPWTNAYKAIDLAFRIGVFVGSTRTASNAIQGWKRELTSEANEKKKKESYSIQEIIDEEAIKYWERGGKRQPSFTARMIAPKVRERINELNPVPASWKRSLGDENKLRDAIRKRLPTCMALG